MGERGGCGREGRVWSGRMRHRVFGRERVDGTVRERDMEGGGLYEGWCI